MERKQFKGNIDLKIDCKKYEGCSTEEKVREQNRIRQLAKTAREKMPKDYESFCLVAAHLVKNAHRYYSNENEEKLKSNVNEKIPAAEPVVNLLKAVNQKLHSI